MARNGRWRYEYPYKDLPKGYIQYQWDVGYPTVIDDNISNGLYKYSILDSVGNPVADSDCNIGHYTTFTNPGVSGSFGATESGHYCKASGYIPPRMRGDLAYPYLYDAPMQNPSYLSTEVFARTNPNRPDYNIGQWVQNLVEMPSMIKSIGDLLRSGRSAIGGHGVANNALAAKFGWIPLMDDVGKLLDVGKNIARRNEELRRLQSGKGIRRRVKLHEQSNTPTDNGVFVDSGYPLYMSANLTVKNVVKQWGTIRWRPNDPRFLAGKSDHEILSLAKRLSLGLTASGAFASAWDVLPWTWLQGWFANTRSYVLAHGNTVPVYPDGKICVMSNIVHTRELNDFHLAQGLSCGAFKVVWDWKFRNTYDQPSLAARLPYLSGDRLSTLALLAVQRLRR